VHCVALMKMKIYFCDLAVMLFFISTYAVQRVLSTCTVGCASGDA
jgi:hypothetical protein